MKLLVADFLFVNAHKDMNINFIDAISRFADCDVISLNGYYDDQKESFQKKNINLINIDTIKKTSPLGARQFSLELMRKTAMFVRENTYDAVFCMGFETTLFGLGLPNFHGIPMFLFYHKNIDELTNKVKRMAFRGYKHKVYHIVFEEFFRDRLVRGIRTPADRVFVIPHPVRPIVDVQTDKSYDCIGLCNSNDEGFIQDAIQRERDFLQNDLHILLRSKNTEKKNGAVEVIKGFMKKETYDKYMAAGKTFFVPLPETYIYRLSGSIYDALSRGKPVYTTSKYYAKEYERRYPGTCRYVNSVEQLIEQLQRKQYIKATNSFQKFMDNHSIETVSYDIEKMVKTVLKEV